MESFEDIRKQEFTHLTGEIVALGRKLVELGWRRDRSSIMSKNCSLNRWTPRLEIPTQAARRVERWRALVTCFSVL